ncbi:hypothetical protein BJ912DRAFT_866845, partial [Pholiota molesta]
SFSARAKNLVPLSLLRMIADAQPSGIHEEIAGHQKYTLFHEFQMRTVIDYIFWCADMDLVTRGWLSV